MSFKSVFIYSACLFALALSGCYQMHSDDDLRTIPSTNNPNIIQDSNRSNMPAAGY